MTLERIGSFMKLGIMLDTSELCIVILVLVTVTLTTVHEDAEKSRTAAHSSQLYWMEFRVLMNSFCFDRSIFKGKNPG